MHVAARKQAYTEAWRHARTYIACMQPEPQYSYIQVRPVYDRQGSMWFAHRLLETPHPRVYMIKGCSMTGTKAEAVPLGKAAGHGSGLVLGHTLAGPLCKQAAAAKLILHQQTHTFQQLHSLQYAPVSDM